MNLIYQVETNGCSAEDPIEMDLTLEESEPSNHHTMEIEVIINSFLNKIKIKAEKI